MIVIAKRFIDEQGVAHFPDVFSQHCTAPVDLSDQASASTMTDYFVADVQCADPAALAATGEVYIWDGDRVALAAFLTAKGVTRSAFLSDISNFRNQSPELQTEMQAVGDLIGG